MDRSFTSSCRVLVAGGLRQSGRDRLLWDPRSLHPSTIDSVTVTHRSDYRSKALGVLGDQLDSGNRLWDLWSGRFLRS